MSDTFCTDCKRYTEVVVDHAAGDTVCSECGLVLESRAIDETSEWRIFADDSGSNDPTRVGGPANPLLPDGVFTTEISRPFNEDAPLARSKNRVGDPHGAVVMGFSSICNIADRLCLVTTSKDWAKEIYKRLDDQKCTRGRNLMALAAACIYIACRKEGKPRTVKEICSVTSGATKKEIGRAKEFIVKRLKVEMGKSMEMGTIHAEDYLRRFCSNLGMSNKDLKAVQETVLKSEELDIRRSPVTVAAAVIFMITQLSNSKKPLRDISVATTVAGGTIKNAYKDILPYAPRIVPDWYATQGDLKNLCHI